MAQAVPSEAQPPVELEPTSWSAALEAALRVYLRYWLGATMISWRCGGATSTGPTASRGC
jgi:hypothetical protein